MQKVALGKTGLMVSPICFGSLTVGPLQNNIPVQEGARVIRYALEQGINFIDAAKLYQTYPYINEALKGWDKEVIIATKSYDYTSDGLWESLEEARKSLDRDVIDIFLLHEQESELTLQGHQEAWDALLEAKAKGMVKAIGISTHFVAGVQAAINRADVEVVHPIINMQGLGIVDGGLEEMLTAVEQAYHLGKGIYGMKPIGGGNLWAKAQEALEYVFNLPFIHSTAIGMKANAEVDLNLSIYHKKEIPESLKVQVEQTSRRLRISSWCEGCGACIGTCQFQALYLEDGKAKVTEKCMLCGYCGKACPNFSIKII